MSTAAVLAGLLTLFALLAAAAGWLIHRHSDHRHARHRQHRAQPYTDRIRPLIARSHHR